MQQTARREARIASRIANQHSDTIRNTRTTLDTTTRSGRRSGRARSKEFKLVVERWKHSFTHIMDNLNWEVYSIEHLSEEKYNEITHEGREAHIEALINEDVPMPGKCRVYTHVTSQC